MLLCNTVLGEKIHHGSYASLHILIGYMLKMQGPDHFLPGQFLKVVFAETTSEGCGNISFQTKSRFASAFYKSVELSKLNVTLL